MEKCWLCLDWVLGGGKPACVQACVLGARTFGRRDDPDSEVAKLINSGRALQLHPEFGTIPGIIHYVFPGD
jgi:Fe-S-cluster-containing dehydrogenase component